MTTVVAWAGVDQRGPGSLYLASDSRISWGGPRTTWDRGRKLFAARHMPHLLSYCGDAFFPTQVLSQIIDMIDEQLLCLAGQTPIECIRSITCQLEASLKAYPTMPEFTILHAMRFGEGSKCHFFLHRVAFSKGYSGNPLLIDMPSRSEVLTTLGSGSSSFNNSMTRWRNSDSGGTSRAVFSALCDFLHGSNDPLSSPPPQLIGLYRIGGGKAFGVVWKGTRYFYGSEVTHTAGHKNIKWHNDLFEVSDPITLVREADARQRPRPRGLE